MRTTLAIKSNIEIGIILLLIPVLPFITTFLIDIPIIAQSFARQLMVYLLMIIEIIVLFLLLKSAVTRN